MTGKYTLVNITGDGAESETTGMNEGDSMKLAKMLSENTGISIEDANYINLLSNSKFKILVGGYDKDELAITEGTFETDGKNIAFNSDNVIKNAKIEGNQIHLDMDGMDFIFEKKK